MKSGEEELLAIKGKLVTLEGTSRYIKPYTKEKTVYYINI